LQKALSLLQQARELDPSFAQAYATESFAHAALTVLGFLAPSEGWEKARSLVVKAIELDDSLAEAHSYYGMALMLADWDWPQAEAELRRAVALKPEDPNTHGWLAELLLLLRRFDEALAEAQRAYEIDPLSVEGNRKRALCELFSGDHEACIQSCRRVLELDPRHALAHFYLGLAQYFSGKLDDALKTVQGASGSLSYDPLLYSGLGYVLGRAGRVDEARKVLAEFQAGRTKGLPCSWLISVVHLGLGENDEALSALEQTVEEREGLATYANVFPMFEPVRSEPRFQALMRKMNLA
jgi:tetratricopeptide (TPR) repeat protein